MNDMSSFAASLKEVPGSHNFGWHERFSIWLRQHAILASFIILVCSLSTRLLFTLSADPNQLTFPDSQTYLVPALSLMESGYFLNKRHGPEVSRTPGYPVFLAASMYIVGKTLRNLLIAQTVLVSFSVLILYWLARQILPPMMAFIGALLAAFSPWGAARAGFLLTEALYLLILVLLFLVMFFTIEHTKKLLGVLFGGGLIGLLTGAAVLVRPTWPLVPIVAAVVFILCKDKRSKAWILIIVMLVCAGTPLHLWKTRNLREAGFDGLSTISGVAAYEWLASGVMARVDGANGDRWAMKRAAEIEDYSWRLTIQDANDERWRRAQAVFREHPFLTAYTFALNAGEAIIHPDPGVLTPFGLNFYGDTWVLSGVWGAILIFAALGLSWACYLDTDVSLIQWKWLLAFLCICLLLTVISGFTFGAGSRYRAPLELIVPLLAGIGLLRVINYYKSSNIYVPHQTHSGKSPIS
jgi:4-amino-4-deoxy-L-arabinose transferase-like glycosyltransferase